MTREEAIKHIKDIICENNTVKHSNIIVFEEEKEALRIAIKALEQEPTMRDRLEKEYLLESIREDLEKLQAENDELRKQIEPCDDTISREDAIKAFADMRDGYPQFHGDMISDYMVAKILKELPPVTPSRPKGLRCRNGE